MDVADWVSSKVALAKAQPSTTSLFRDFSQQAPGAGAATAGPMVSARLNGGLKALSHAPDWSKVVAAGSDDLRILSLSEQQDGLKEVMNLRVGTRANLNVSSIDVAWHPNDNCSHEIATAAANGSVVLWDLGRHGNRQRQVISEHQRTVNCIRFHATEVFTLLSASQDRTVKRWDLRATANAVATFQPREGVRQVAMNPHSAVQFAAVLENGNLQIWDWRSDTKPLSNLQAHQGPAYSCDWHPVIKDQLASAGRDKAIRLWDTSQTGRKAMLNTISTIASVRLVKWRPGCKDQIASCALVQDYAVQVWSWARPHLPIASFQEHKDVVTGIAWGPADGNGVMLSCSKDATVVRRLWNDRTQPYKDADRRSTGVCWAPNGNLVSFSKVAVAPTSMERPKTLVKNLFGPRAKPEVKPTSGPQFATASQVLQLSGHRARTGSRVAVAEDSPQDVQDTFALIARRCRFEGKSKAELCDINSAVYTSVGQFQHAQTWKILKGLLCEEHTDKHTAEPGDTDAAPPGENGEDIQEWLATRRLGMNGEAVAAEEEIMDVELDVADAYYHSLKAEAVEERCALSDSSEGEQDSEVDESELPDMLLENDGLPALHKGLSNAGLKLPDPTVGLLEWQPSQCTSDLLQFYGDQGDPQMCSTMILVFGEQMCTDLDEELVAVWFESYCDLLDRHRLWNVRAMVGKHCHVADIQSQSQESRISTNCDSCQRPLQDKGYWCSGECKKLTSPCSVCHLTVKGLYVWCQGCGHGGHLEHMRQWFEVETTCPTGCGHNCHEWRR